MTTVLAEVCFDSYYNLSSLCNSNAEDQSYWLSWNFLDKTYKSDEFTKIQNGPSLLKNNTRFDVNNKNPNNLIPPDVLKAFPFRVFLCTTHTILAVANVNPFRIESVDRENITSTMPFELSEWADFVPIDPNLVGPDYYQEGRGASIKVTLRITQDRHDQDEYGDEDFETEETEVITSVKEHNKHVHFPKNEMKHQEKIAQLEEEEEENRLLRHYRLSIDMRSIGGFKRPAHVGLHYIYPYLGTSTPVRTKPTWVMANTEARVDNGTATFECAMSREQLRNTLSEHPLKITALTKSHLGNNILGELKVDLASVTYAEPHSYRCVLTNKTFKTRLEYNKHRQVLLSLVSAGQIEHAPPRDPIVINAVDSYLVFTSPTPESRHTSYTTTSSTTDTTTSTGESNKGTPNYIVPLAEGGKLRVVLILEDLGVVGGETAVPVRPGYKMHNGAVYDRYGQPSGGSSGGSSGMYDTTSTTTAATTAATMNTGNSSEEQVNITIHNLYPNNTTTTNIPHTLDTTTTAVEINGEIRPLTLYERKTLEKLHFEWEKWRKLTENNWKENLYEKEQQLKKKLEMEISEKLINQVNDLKKAQIETGKLEIRLKNSINEIEKQKSLLLIKEEQIQNRLINKTTELQLLQKKIRDDSKNLINNEKIKSDNLEKQLKLMSESYNLLEKRYKEQEIEYDNYRIKIKKSTEYILLEENNKLKIELNNLKLIIEKEKNEKSNIILEKEHFRSQMQRIALALKNEREKSSIIARQEIEQLRLEFLAREER